MSEKRRFNLLIDDENPNSEWSNQIDQNQPHTQNLKYNWQENANYKVEISTSVYLMGKQINENKTESIWEINYSPTTHSIKVNISKKKIIKIDGQIKALINIIDKINKVTDNLNLRINENKTVDYVLDLGLVLKKWEEIKFEELKIHQLEDEFFDKVIKAYDAEFNDLTNSIQLNILYQLLFYPQGLVKYPAENSRLILENKKTNSQLFFQQLIYYDLFYKSKVENSKIIVSCFSEPSKKWDKQGIAQNYLENYLDLLGNNFDFKFKIEGQYIYKMDGILEKGIIYVKEQANEKLFYIGQYNFTQIEKTETSAKK